MDRRETARGVLQRQHRRSHGHRPLAVAIVGGLPHALEPVAGATAVMRHREDHDLVSVHGEEQRVGELVQQSSTRRATAPRRPRKRPFPDAEKTRIHCLGEAPRGVRERSRYQTTAA